MYQRGIWDTSQGELQKFEDDSVPIVPNSNGRQ